MHFKHVFTGLKYRDMYNTDFTGKIYDVIVLYINNFCP